jgi:hypothetical protein
MARSNIAVHQLANGFQPDHDPRSDLHVVDAPVQDPVSQGFDGNAKQRRCPPDTHQRLDRIGWTSRQ